MTELKKAARVERIEATEQELQVGSWWWIYIRTHDKGESEKGTRMLCCLTHVGSNYAAFESVGASRYTDIRVHFDKFHEECEPETNAEHIIKQNVERHRVKTVALMEQVKDVTARLALNAGQSSETESLVLHTGAQPINDYKTALVKAKDETLPALFDQIKKNNEMMGRWMGAALVPLEAASNGLKPQVKKIENRIFNVELYAGLIEEVVQIAEGNPAPSTEPIHIFQRRAYMDEECLANYRIGGMEYANIKDFDRWFVEPENLDRILPHPRAIIAFQVRRREKVRDVSLSDFIRISMDGTREADKLTFLYMRNGQNVYRLSTGIEFGLQLFPDTERSVLNGDHKLWARMDYGKVQSLITEGDYLQRRKDAAALAKKVAKERKEWQAQVDDLKARGIKHGDDAWPDSVSYFGPSYYSDENLKDYKPWTPDSVFYDDISNYVQQKIEEHNRLVLVLQGLLDRSDVFAPHPPYRIWEAEDFGKAFALVYEDSRGLTGGEPPNFEVYRTLLNKTLRVGSVTVGQEDYWEEVEAEKENARQANDWRIRDKSNYRKFRPYGNPGPGTLARIASMGTKGAGFKWGRERLRPSRWNDDDGPLTCTLTVPKDRLLNVEAYTPGDFRLFFNDPRTRADYLEWAPYLLEAEEFHAGNRGIRPFYTTFKEASGTMTQSYKPGQFKVRSGK